MSDTITNGDAGSVADLAPTAAPTPEPTAAPVPTPEPTAAPVADESAADDEPSAHDLQRSLFRTRLVNAQNRIHSAKSRLMLDELADATIEVTAILIEMLG